MNYKTELRDTVDGRATYGVAFVMARDGATWLLIGYSRNMWTYPRRLRARTAAENIARKYHRKYYSGMSFVIHRH